MKVHVMQDSGDKYLVQGVANRPITMGSNLRRGLTFDEVQEPIRQALCSAGDLGSGPHIAELGNCEPE
jgi:hypothetical protein